MIKKQITHKDLGGTGYEDEGVPSISSFEKFWLCLWPRLGIP